MAKFSFLPREVKFFTLFGQSADNMVKGAQALKELVDTWENVEARTNEITEIEHQGDTITHEIIAQLNQTFITPFDREDISLLAHSLDDVVDFIQSAADSMLLYKINAPDKRAQELAAIIVLAAVEVQKAIGQLKHRAQFKELLNGCVEINRLENSADHVYRAALGELFECRPQVTDIIKWREIYEHLETATDRCEDVANVLEGVALKHA